MTLRPASVATGTYVERCPITIRATKPRRCEVGHIGPQASSLAPGLQGLDVMNVAPMLVCGVLALGCVGEGSVETWRSRIGEEATCDRAEATCWHEVDRERMAGAYLALVDAGSGTMERRTGELCAAWDDLAALSHKLGPEQNAWLAATRPSVCASGLDEMTLARAAGDLVDTVVVTLESGYLSAHLEPVAEDIEQLASAETTGSWSAAWGAKETPVSSSWPVGVQAAVRNLSQAGTLAEMYVAMLSTAGVFDRDYARANAELFADAPGMSEQERVDRIVADAAERAAWIGLATGAAVAVPIAGVAISIAFRTRLVMPLQAEVALRIAEARGFDPRAEDTVVMAVALALAGGYLPMPLDSLVANGVETGAFVFLGVPLARAVMQRLAAQLTADVARQGVGRIAMSLLGTLTAGLVSGAAGAAVEAAMMWGFGGRVDAAWLEYRRLRAR